MAGINMVSAYITIVAIQLSKANTFHAEVEILALFAWEEAYKLDELLLFPLFLV
jgi:hypothetical protein